MVQLASEEWVCGHSLAGNAGSNPAGGVNGCLCRAFCVVSCSSLHRSDHLPRGDLPSVVCLRAVVKPRQ